MGKNEILRKEIGNVLEKDLEGIKSKIKECVELEFLYGGGLLFDYGEFEPYLDIMRKAGFIEPYGKNQPAQNVQDYGLTYRMRFLYRKLGLANVRHDLVADKS